MPAKKSEPTPIQKTDRADLLESQIGFQLRLAQLAVFGEIIDRMKQIDLRPVDLSILLLVDDNPGLRQHVLGDRLKIQRPNVVGLVDGLQARGLIKRDVDQIDRRANQLRLTPGGKRVLEEAKAIQRAHGDRLYEALDAEQVDVENFMRGLRALAALSPRTSADNDD